MGFSRVDTTKGDQDFQPHSAPSQKDTTTPQEDHMSFPPSNSGGYSQKDDTSSLPFTQPSHPSRCIGWWWRQHPPKHSVSADMNRQKLLDDWAPSQAHVVHDQHTHSHKCLSRDSDAVDLRTIYFYI
ncbi:hypothetical protein EUGRSUZ_H01225 [Eucalyptus grandis]|uniref:Uncharacterized protein n=2 Tax=Eucalyptus grandis TaxID=71139 RepID=A0ACC3JNG7_EUCGR|nr:hypothetical protein EUGRSUZ_H01225 [Eucalyptus grandis]